MIDEDKILVECRYSPKSTSTDAKNKEELVKTLFELRPEGEDEKKIFVRTLHGAKILQDRVYDEDDPKEERRPPKKAVIVYHPPLEKHRTVMMHVVSKERQRERSSEGQRAKELQAEMMMKTPEEYADEKTRQRSSTILSKYK